ncbi:hypothetical protein LXL04_021052 [Taraxacum kok-saghyz]
MAILVPEVTQLTCPNTKPTKTPSKLITGETNPLSLLPKCTYLKEIKQIQAHSIKTDLHRTMYWATKVINHCTLDPTPSSMNHAHQLFDQIPHPDVILFNFMARGYSRSHTPLQSLLLFIRITSMGIAPDHYTFPSLLKSCANAKALQEGKQLHSLAIKHGLNQNPYLYPSLINMYTECDNIGLAQLVFDRIKEPCAVTYNAIITGLVQNNRPNDALLMFQEMQNKSLKPTDVTMLSVLQSCSLLGALNTGKWVHEYIKSNRFDQYVKVNTTLIDMYTKCGDLNNAVLVFENMGFKDTQTWSTMIMSYAIHGHVQKAISLFSQMEKEKVPPDEITLLGLLQAFNHSGQVDKSLSLFHTLKGKFGISPTIKHYGCVLDTLGRSGRLQEAYKFISEIPKPSLTLWRTLLASCHLHGNLELGQKVASRIFELDDSHGGDYVIFSNMCAKGGNQENAIKIRKLMKEKGVVKVPGCSAIEVNNQVHEFFCGDNIGICHKEFHDNLFEELKVVGYEADVSLVVHLGMEDDEKEGSLRYHSEKLAVSFGVLNSRKGETVRVTKNLRICGDCHSACKALSLVCDREIFVRDVHRFHHFVKGKCSCGDYW